MAQVEIYVDALARRCGVGRRLLTQLVSEAENCGIWSLQAIITGDDGGGLYLHRRCGFRVIGTRERVAQLNGEWRGQLLMERRSRVVGADGPGIADRPGPGTPEWKAACEETARVLAPICLTVAQREVERARVLGIGVPELQELYRRGARSRKEDDRLIEKVRAERYEQRARELQSQWDDEVRAEIERRKREGLPYQHILGYFDRPE